MEKNSDTTARKGRRYLQTEEQLKNALLKLLKVQRFEEVTIVGLCRQAQVTRATFYQHHDNLAALLDAVVDDAIRAVRDVSLDMVERCFPGDKDTTGVRVGRAVEGGTPLCHLVVYENRFQPLFNDNDVVERFVKQAVELSLDTYEENGGHTMSREQLRAVNTYRMNGCLAVAREAARSGKDWLPMQAVVDRLSFVGLSGL